MTYTIKTLDENGAQFFSFWSFLGNGIWDSHFANAKLFANKKEALKNAKSLSKVTDTDLVIVKMEN